MSKHDKTKAEQPERSRAQMLTMGQGEPKKETNDGGPTEDPGADEQPGDPAAQADGDGQAAAEDA